MVACSETESKEAAVFLGIGQRDGQHMFPEVETVNLLLERIVFVHRNDVLEAQFFRGFGPDLQGADNLAAIDAIEEVAVVDQESGAYATLGAETHEHHVEAENLHVLDALATGTLH